MKPTLVPAAVDELAALIEKCVATPETPINVLWPLVVVVTVSAAKIDSLPAAAAVALKTLVPATSVLLAGSDIPKSVLLKCTVPP